MEQIIGCIIIAAMFIAIYELAFYYTYEPNPNRGYFAMLGIYLGKWFNTTCTITVMFVLIAFIARCVHFAISGTWVW